MSPIGICALCKNKVKLVRRSHVFSRFMYEGMFDTKNRVIQSDLADQNKDKFLQSGIIDHFLFCYKCENERLGRLEKYAKIVLLGGQLKAGENTYQEKRISSDGIQSVFISNVDYTKFKLFLLSLLLRTAVSRLPFFKDIKIPFLVDTLSDMILNHDAKSEQFIPIAIYALTITQTELLRFVFKPIEVFDGENSWIYFVVNGLLYTFCIKDNTGVSRPFFLKQNGTIEVPIYNRSQTKNITDAYYQGKVFERFMNLYYRE